MSWSWSGKKGGRTLMARRVGANVDVIQLLKTMKGRRLTSAAVCNIESNPKAATPFKNMPSKKPW
jgi:hypothetical protein